MLSCLLNVGRYGVEVNPIADLFPDLLVGNCVVMDFHIRPLESLTLRIVVTHMNTSLCCRVRVANSRYASAYLCVENLLQSHLRTLFELDLITDKLWNLFL